MAQQAPLDMTRFAMATYGRLFLRELRGRQVDVAPALLALGRPEEKPQQPESSAARFVAFLDVCEQLAGDRSLGLRAGQRVQLDDLSLVGLLMRASVDGRSMVEDLLRHQASWQGSLDVHVELHETSVRICQLPLPGLPASASSAQRLLADCALARTLAVARMMLGLWVRPQRVELSVSRPSDSSAHEALFGCPLHFGAPQNALAFATDLLLARSPQRDPALHRVLERHLLRAEQTTVASAPRSVAPAVERVRQVLARELSTGNTGLQHTAAILQCSERTLRRQLQRAGTSYQELLDDQRRQLALDHLRDHPRRSAVQLSDALGFSNPAAFYRAFKRWTGARWSTYHGERTATVHLELAPL